MDIKNLTNLTNEILRKISDYTNKSSKTLADGSVVSFYDSQKYAMQIQTDATYTYVAEALPGTATSSATWRAKRIVTATGTTTWADSNTNFDNVATDLTALTYA